MVRIAIIVFAAVSFSMGAYGQPAPDYMRVFGLPLGQPKTLPRCPESRLVTPKETCFREPKGVASSGHSQDIWLVFPGLGAELVRPGAEIMGFLIDGALEGVAFPTKGGGNVAAQLTTIDTLSAKYGRPAEQSKRQVQNAFGAGIEDFTAQWRLPGLTVKFEGAADMTQGYVSIFTDKMNAAVESRLQDVRKSQRKL
jgi:hypothetical protein